jgi:hypothetical protein
MAMAKVPTDSAEAGERVDREEDGVPDASVDSGSAQMVDPPTARLAK